MPRTSRLNPQDGWHHVMSRGVDRQPVFFDDEDRIAFGQLVGVASERFDIEVHAYCLLDNHFHLLVRCPNGNLSDAMHYLLSVFARRVNDRAGRVGHLFGSRFTSRLITTYGYLANVVRYIHRNALDVRGVGNVDQYRWSSHNHYLAKRPPLEWLHTNTVLGWFDDSASFHRFVERDAIASNELSFETVEELSVCVDLVLEERSNSSRRHRPAQRRAVLLTLREQASSSNAASILDHLGIPNAGALRTAEHRARRIIADEPAVNDTAARAAQLFSPCVLLRRNTAA